MSCKGPSSVFDLLDSAPPSSGAETDEQDHGHLEQCSDCRERHGFYSQLREQIRQSQQEKLPELSRARLLKAVAAEFAAQAPVTEEAHARPAQPSIAAAPPLAAVAKGAPTVSRWKVWGSGLVAAAGLVLFSTAALFQTPPSGAAQMAAALATDHGRCEDKVPFPAHPERDPAEVAHSAFGRTPEIPSFPDLNRLDCRVCSIDSHRRAIHVLYRSPSAQLVSMFELPADTPNDLGLPESNAERVEPHMLTQGQHNILAWRHDGWLHFLVSDIPSNQLAQIARDGRYYLARGGSQPPRSPSFQALPASFRH